MNSMEFNKIAAGCIGALLVFLLLNFFSAEIYGTREFAEHTINEDEEGPVLAYAVAVESGGGATEEAPQVDLLALFQHPDVAAGEKVFRACGACHSAEKGENKVGPSLWDVVGRDVASVSDFSYSDAMAAVEGDWTPEHLFHFLENPKALVPGTKMSFAGLKDPQDRVNVIAWLNQHGDAPVDLTAGIEPLAPPTEATGEQAEGEGAAAGGEAATTPAVETVTDVAAASAGSETAGGAGGAAAEGSSVPVGTEQSATETTASSTTGEQAVTVTDREVVDTSKENVEVSSTAPVEVEKVTPTTEGGAPVTEPGQATAESVPADTGTAPVPPAGAAAPEQPAAGADETVAAATPAAGSAMPAGDAAAGEKLFRRCQACHKVEPGENAIGPTLYGVVGRPVASVEDYNYSDAMKAHGGVWTPERLDTYLADPRGVVPGTKMAFAGLKKEQDRIDVITYLEQASQ